MIATSYLTDLLESEIKEANVVISLKDWQSVNQMAVNVLFCLLAMTFWSLDLRFLT